MTEHPARWFIAALVVYVACRSAVYLRTLRGAIRVLEDAEPTDEMAIYSARRREGLIRWLLTAQGCNVIWAVGVVLTDTTVTWHTLMAFTAVFAGQLAVAWGIRSSARGDARFLELFRDRTHRFCNDFSCPYRIERESAARTDAPWRESQ